MRPKLRPLLTAQNHNRDLAPRNILLILHIPVGRQQQIEARRFGRAQQIAVPEPVPALFSGCADGVTRKVRAKRHGRCLIKKDTHLGPRKRAPYRDFAQRTRSPP